MPTCRSDLPGTDGPDRLVSNDNLRPSILADDLVYRFQLFGDDINCRASFSLLQRLSAAQNHTDTTLDSSLGLGCYEIVGFVQESSSFAVTEDRPCDVAIFQL